MFQLLRICPNLQTDIQYSRTRGIYGTAQLKEKKKTVTNEAQMISKSKTVNNLNKNHCVQSRYEHIIKKQSAKWQGVVHTQPWHPLSLNLAQGVGLRWLFHIIQVIPAEYWSHKPRPEPPRSVGGILSVWARGWDEGRLHSLAATLLFILCGGVSRLSQLPQGSVSVLNTWSHPLWVQLTWIYLVEDGAGTF